MRFPDSFLAELKARLPLSEVVKRRVNLRKNGREWTGLSPFSNEKTPSFFVNDEKGVYYCFSTGEKGDMIAFIQKTERLSFAESVERLARDAGLPLPAVSEQDSQKQAEQASKQAVMRDLIAQAARYFSEALQGPKGEAAREYLSARGLPPSAWTQHQIGYAPPGWRNLIEHLTNKGAKLEHLIEAGLAVAPEQKDKTPWDRFRNRIMFTITDRAGRAIAFGGRVLLADDKPKYLNSPEGVLFSKGRMLYRYAQARQSLADQDSSVSLDGLILVEGYTDAIAMAQAGFGMATAPLGTAVTEQQLALIWQAGPEPVLCLDGDRAGLGAALRVAELALPHLSAGRTLNFALLPDGLDPDDLIRQRGVSAMREALDQARPLIDVLWAREWERQPVDTPERRVGLEQRLDKLVARIEDKPVREAYRRELRDRLFASTSALGQSRRNSQRTGTGRRHIAARGKQPVLMARGPVRRAGLALIARVTESSALLDMVAETLARARFADADVGTIRDQVLQIWEGGQTPDRQRVTENLYRLGKKRAASLLAELPEQDALDPDSDEGRQWIRALDAFAGNSTSEEEADKNRDMFVSTQDPEIRRDAWERRRDLLAEQRRARSRQHD